ncbi:YggT family protein [Leifsonia sp. LS1]|uniref:YggT family protein n=1 Tax=unclassified Leifsonia TaxID=2663824 RepID=UPI001CBF02A3|nr:MULTISPECIES: YggT family protein [unclassified Leifsonia]UAJ78080.1 YggT family protein [Leifsonia sp. ZF2019]GIT80099.1 YggT family protein [Leifsonia sp. LS1]
MFVVSIVATVAYYLLLIYFFVMWARFVLDLVRTFARQWRPKGFGLLLAESTYVVTDPPIKFFRRIIPPLSMGQVALDFGWSLTMLVVIIGLYVTLGFS